MTSERNAAPPREDWPDPETVIAALQDRIEVLEGALAECDAELEREVADTAEAIAHIVAAFVADLDRLCPLSQLPFRLRLAVEELCARLAIARPWVAPR